MCAKPIAMSGADIDVSDVEAVVEVLRSGRLALGPRCEAFENAVADYVGAAHAVAVSSGTAALHTIVRACGLGAGDEVIVPSFTFAATVNALIYEGVTPVFAEIDPATFNLCPNDARRKISDRTEAIMAVDAFGHPAEWDALLELAAERGLLLIDDACEALGAEYRERKLGRFGEAAAFAFYPNKQITTGEGGMIVTDDGELAAAARSLRNQGRPDMGPWLQHEQLGFNYRMDEMSAALGLSQMQRIDGLLARRQDVAAMYESRLRGLPWVRCPTTAPHVVRSWFVYVVTLAEGLDRDRLIDGLAQCGIPARAYFAPIHLQPYIERRFGRGAGLLPVTEAVAGRTLALPFHAALDEGQVQRVVDTLIDRYESGAGEFR